MFPGSGQFCAAPISTRGTSTTVIVMSTPKFTPPQTITHTVANRLVELVRAGKHIQAINELYADNARHIEPMVMPGSQNMPTGKAGLLAMAEHWNKITTVHSASVGDPSVNADQFICDMSLDCTSTEGPMANQRVKMSETCLYTVKDAKITEAKFFYRSMTM